MIFENKGEEIEFCLFNLNEISIRYQKIKPNNQWGCKDELIGAEIGCGPAYKLPIYLLESKLHLDKQKEKLTSIKEIEEQMAMGTKKTTNNLKNLDAELKDHYSDNVVNNNNQIENSNKKVQEIKKDIQNVEEFKEIIL